VFFPASYDFIRASIFFNKSQIFLRRELSEIPQSLSVFVQMAKSKSCNISHKVAQNIHIRHKTPDFANLDVFSDLDLHPKDKNPNNIIYCAESKIILIYDIKY